HHRRTLRSQALHHGCSPQGLHESNVARSACPARRLFTIGIRDKASDCQTALTRHGSRIRIWAGGREAPDKGAGAVEKIGVIIPAAGKSARFADPKQKKIYAELAGRAVWLRAVEPFVNRDDVAQIILAIAPEDRERFERRYRDNVAFMNIKVIDGGPARSDTIARALQSVSPDCEFIA